jgi:thiol-disulfide isomerase/thioredoxin
MLFLFLLWPALAFGQSGLSFQSPEAVIERYLWDHPQPARDALPEHTRGYYLRLSTESAKWMRAWPDSAAAISEHARAIRALSASGGGSSAGWVRRHKPMTALPPFEFGGSVTLVNIWATWCAPCLAELPHLQRLHESGVRMITLNVDSEPAVAARFLSERGYTLPVMFAKKLVEDTLGINEFPLTWVVDTKQIIRLEHGAFLGDPKRWREELLSTIVGLR